MKNKLSFFGIISLAIISCTGNNEIVDQVENPTILNKKAPNEKEITIIKKESQAMFEKLNDLFSKMLK